MRNYIRKADRIDKERGDVLQIAKENIKPLFAPSYPKETCKDLLYALIRWFVGGEEPHLTNPLADAQLQSLIENQKKSVREYLDFCRIRAENRAIPLNQNGATLVTPGATLVTPGATLVGNKESNKVKDKRSESFTFTDGGIGRAADAPPSPPVTVTATATTIEDAKRKLEELAPPLDEKHYPKEDIAWWGDFKFQDADYIVSDILCDIEEEGNAQTENALKKYHRELGATLFFYAYVKYDADRRKLRASGDDWENAGAVLMSRLKLVKAAKYVVEAKK